MAKDLRSLKLRSTEVAIAQDPKLSAASNQQSSHQGIVIRPPKRPQIQRPRYLDLEATQPPPAESNEQSPEETALEQSPQQGKKIDIDYEDEVPTRPLSPIDLDTQTQQKIEQAQHSTKANTETKRTLWKQLQRIFKQSLVVWQWHPERQRRILTRGYRNPSLTLRMPVGYQLYPHSVQTESKTLHSSSTHVILEASKQSGKVEKYLAWILRN